MDTEFIKSSDIKALRSFLGSESWTRIKLQWMLDYPRPAATSDAQLIRNAITHEAWQQCIERFASYADPKQREVPEKEDGLEYVNEQSRPE